MFCQILMFFVCVDGILLKKCYLSVYASFFWVFFYGMEIQESMTFSLFLVLFYQKEKTSRDKNKIRYSDVSFKI